MNLRLAIESDLSALRQVMARAIAELQKPYLTPEQLQASAAMMGLDTRLIADRSYFIVEIEGSIAGCGGWSHRATLYGGDHSAGRDESPLDPATDPARVRAMYTNPDFARRGVGREILRACEQAAQNSGFRRAELMATLAGQPLYLAAGYVPIEAILDTNGAVPVPLIRMGKSFDPC